MTTARRPPSSPKPRLTRPPATQPEPKNPITTEIMQRVRRVIAKSNGTITIPSIADELKVARPKLAEWIGCWRSAPYGDNLIAIMRWLAIHDDKFVGEIIQATNIKFRGEVADIQFRKLSSADVADIRNAPEEPGTIARLAKKYDVHQTMIRHVRNGVRY